MVFAPATTFTVPQRLAGTHARPHSRPRADAEPVAIGALIASLASEHWQTVTFRDGPDTESMTSRFCFVRMRAANRTEKRTPRPPREEWLIAEWPEGREQPTDYWISNLPNVPRQVVETHSSVVGVVSAVSLRSGREVAGDGQGELERFVGR